MKLQDILLGLALTAVSLVALITALLIISALFFSNGPTPGPTVTPGPSVHDLKSHCRLAVKETMHNPRSAEFENVTAGPVVSSSGKARPNRFAATGQLYGTNLYGATVRQQFRCDFLYWSNDDRIELTDLTVE